MRGSSCRRPSLVETWLQGVRRTSPFMIGTNIQRGLLKLGTQPVLNSPNVNMEKAFPSNHRLCTTLYESEDHAKFLRSRLQWNTSYLV